MKLSKVQIRQFRSIASVDIEFERECLILLGINETGKTNILHALALLSSNRTVAPDDKRQPLVDEPTEAESYVRFVFALEQSDLEEIAEAIREQTLDSFHDRDLTIDDHPISIENLIARVAYEGLYTVAVPAGTRHYSHWRFDDRLQISNRWFVPESVHPRFKAEHPTRGNVAISELKLVDGRTLSQVPQSEYRQAKPEDLVDLIGTATTELVKSKLPRCIFWSYREDSVLPASIDWNAFLSNPALYPIIKNLFDVSGIANITQTVDRARTRSNGVRALLEHVSKKVTAHIRSAWDGFSELAIELHENGKVLECLIRDSSGAYTFQQRSDGFRRFTGFLLMISAQASSGRLKDALLLYDEPDTSLHPSGAKQLRAELLRLSRTNQVVYSTHSIFMVDPSCIERHLIVDKRNEKTFFEKARYGNIADEEVLYRAIGHSVFDVLRPSNLILEGWRDKRLFEVALRDAEESLVSAFKNIGLCHAGGVKLVPHVAPMIEALSRPFLIVTDADKPARDSQAKFAQDWPWKTYADFLGNRFVTAEDFVTLEKLQETVERVSGGYPELASVALSIQDQDPFMMQIELALAGTHKERKRVILNAMKDELFESLECSDIREECCLMLKAIVAELGARISR